MVRAKQKSKPVMGVLQATPAGTKKNAPPLVTRGERREIDLPVEADQVNQLVREGRERLNLSVGPNVKKAVVDLAGVLGMTESQLVVHALLMAFPQLQQQAAAVQLAGS